MFDINLSQENAANRLQYLADALYLDNATDIVTVRVITYNGELSMTSVLGRPDVTFSLTGTIVETESWIH